MNTAKQDKVDFKSKLARKAQLVNSLLKQLVAEQYLIQDDLRAALEYALFAPGKRLRAALVLWCCRLVASRVNTDAEIAAAAIEMVHTYSLMHDDLPAMDDDDMRRGRPSCHKAFDEATAILAGDALLTLSFEVLAKKVADSSVAVRLIAELAEAAGPAGMVAGQMADLKAEKTVGSEEILQYIHTNKTARMFRCACRMGAIAGDAAEKQLERLSEYGLKIGLAYQIADDILDVSGSSEEMGKTAGKDARQKKVTYPSVVGLEKAQQIAGKLADEAIKKLNIFGPEANLLRFIAEALLERNK